MLSFRDFQRGPAGHLCERVGMPLRNVPSWNSFAKTFQLINKGGDGELVERLMQFPASSGERGLIMAILHAADYSRFADQMSHGNTWNWLRSVHDDHAEAVAAVILQRNEFGT